MIECKVGERGFGENPLIIGLKERKTKGTQAKLVRLHHRAKRVHGDRCDVRKGTDQAYSPYS